ncbi:hypothetical protein AALB16_07890 [Lachnospiraceae bacterium 62-35]
MKQIIQHILFPDDESLVNYRDLFYHGAQGILTEASEKGHLCLSKYENIEFCTYFNGVSYKKWRKYTDIGTITLCLDLRGECEITLCGYSLVDDIPERRMLAKKRVTANERGLICIEFPTNEEHMLAFEIKTFSEIEIFGGYYEGEFPEENVREVELAISTTTCWKEEYITKNVQRLKKRLLDLDEDISRHLRIHIVDNGRTLNREDFPDDSRIYYHPNKNVGGAGGYARGMIECQQQEPKASHVLLMDDDVMILPDSIFRTYVLLKNIKGEYENSFIGGAMLMLEEKNIQHEDIGTITARGLFNPLKPRWNHFWLRDNLLNEYDYRRENMYQAWWYCCIPMKIIEKNGLPLPLFVRGDDAEYSFRCKPNIITMNGICVWHMGFYSKYNVAMDIYQGGRNLWIVESTTGIVSEKDIVRESVKRNYRENLLKHNYNSAELTLRAFEDYMRGPKFIMQNQGEAIVKENGKLNYKFRPLEEFREYKIDVWADPYYDSKRGFVKKWLYRITYNGHRFWPERFLDKTPVTIPFDWGYTPSKMAMKKTYIAVNSRQKTGYVSELDKQRFKELQKRYYKDIAYYERNKAAIKESYKKARKILTSERFWRKYLEI